MSYIGHDPTPYLPPSVNEVEQTAAKAIQQINLGIRPGVDTVDTALQTSMKRNENYNTGAARPLLPPTITLRTSAPNEEPKVDDRWKEKFNEMVQHLPDDIRNYFMQQQALPPDQRIPSLLIMENVFTFVAKFLILVQQAATPEGTGTVKETQKNLNLLMPEIVKKGLYESGGESLKYLREMLDSMGHNYPYYDHVNLNLQKAEEAFQRIYQSKDREAA